ncbi:hypothetical protein HHI36_014639 [Cryptolaemus montrouzieri]|uniref:Uncharacterized protein n=1 Tax=Cryptolaemus montrouzieri TaxID=559131 RepID=A0ABD2N444_9CUCU
MKRSAMMRCDIEEIENGEIKDDDSRFAPVILEISQFVVFTYENKMYPGEIVGFHEREVLINTMEKSLKCGSGLVREIAYNWEDVLGSMKPQKLISKRGSLLIPELDTIY